jgi:hypothetical protein
MWGIRQTMTAARTCKHACKQWPPCGTVHTHGDPARPCGSMPCNRSSTMGTTAAQLQPDHHATLHATRGQHPRVDTAPVSSGKQLAGLCLSFMRTANTSA